MNAGSSEYLIEVRNLVRTFGSRRERVTAVDDVSFGIREGEVVCLVGESGCGKTTTGKMIAGLLKPTSGQVLYTGKPVWNPRGDKGEDFKKFRLGVQIIHQDPYASLNPSHTIYKILSTPLLHHKLAANTHEALDRVIELLNIVGLSPVEDFLYKYPHQLSGGQRQRVSVARALTVNPRFIVADEPVSMVDASNRAEILSLMRNLCTDRGISFLYITHDLASARCFSDRIAVMYLGMIVETGPARTIIETPLHPYTKGLLAAVPEPDPENRRRERPTIAGDIPSAAEVPAGCPFHPRCPEKMKGLCDQTRPPSTALSDSRSIACHLFPDKE